MSQVNFFYAFSRPNGFRKPLPQQCPLESGFEDCFAWILSEEGSTFCFAQYVSQHRKNGLVNNTWPCPQFGRFLFNLHKRIYIPFKKTNSQIPNNYLSFVFMLSSIDVHAGTSQPANTYPNILWTNKNNENVCVCVCNCKSTWKLNMLMQTQMQMYM